MNCFFSKFSYTQTTVRKRSHMKIIVAIARKILMTVWHMTTKDGDFVDLYLKRLKEKKKLEEKTRILMVSAS